MRSDRGLKAALSAAGVALSAATVGFAPSAWASGGTCSDVTGSHAITVGANAFSSSFSGVHLNAGEVITLTTTATGAGGGGFAMLVGADLVTGTAGPSTVTYTVPTAAIVSIDWGFVSTFTATTTGTISISCAGLGASSTPIVQSINNANTAIQNGQQTLQNFNDWISRGVQTSFSTPSGGSNSAAAQRLAPLSARA